ncbi:transposase family protein [Kitasatospora herbaricolor]|uniref:transposase family protein n=1 Tax=Kitasatospora herbaricolor TaxID=68217 RepID=UPI0036DCA644
MACPGCGNWSERIHSGYERRISDRAVFGHELVLHLRVRRFFCETAECGSRTFAEQILGLTYPLRVGAPALLRKVREAVAPCPGPQAGRRSIDRAPGGRDRP